MDNRRKRKIGKKAKSFYFLGNLVGGLQAYPEKMNVDDCQDYKEPTLSGKEHG